MSAEQDSVSEMSTDDFHSASEPSVRSAEHLPNDQSSGMATPRADTKQLHNRQEQLSVESKETSSSPGLPSAQRQ